MRTPVTSLLRAAPQGMQRKYKLKKYASSKLGEGCRYVPLPLLLPRREQHISYS